MIQYVSHEDAAKALDSLDDYARMGTGVDAHGPRGMLERYITQQAATLRQAPTQGEVTEAPVALTAECYISEAHLRNLRDPEVGICVIERAKSSRATIPLFTLEEVTAALSAQQQQGQGEAVACRYRFHDGNGGWLGWHYSDTPTRKFVQGDRVQCEPLFTAPPAQPAERAGLAGAMHDMRDAVGGCCDQLHARIKELEAKPAERVPEESYRGVPFRVLGKAFQRVLADPSVLWRNNSGAQEFIDRVQGETVALLASPAPSEGGKGVDRG